jgi:hypothetical protein
MEVFWKKINSPTILARKKIFTNMMSTNIAFCSFKLDIKEYIKNEIKNFAAFGGKKQMLPPSVTKKTPPDQNFHAPPENLMVRPLI